MRRYFCKNTRTIFQFLIFWKRPTSSKFIFLTWNFLLKESYIYIIYLPNFWIFYECFKNIDHATCKGKMRYFPKTIKIIENSNFVFLWTLGTFLSDKLSFFVVWIGLVIKMSCPAAEPLCLPPLSSPQKKVLRIIFVLWIHLKLFVERGWGRWRNIETAGQFGRVGGNL